MNTESHETPRGRRQLLLLVAVFFGPLLIAIAMYYGGIGVGERASVNYGEFVEPAVTLEPKLHYDSGVRSRWTLLVKYSGVCDEACNRALIDVRQVRLATGREIDRIERALISDTPPARNAALAEAHPNLKLFDTDSAFAQALAGLADRQVYIIDPIGNVVLRYPLTPERKAMLGDLKKLLKLSRIG